jgi:hypothetical protein
MSEPRYKMLAAKTAEELAEQMDELIALGWVPQGGPFVYTALPEGETDSHPYFGQAVFLPTDH